MNELQSQTTICPQELHRRLAAGQAGKLLDVRTPGEYAAGHVPGAILIPLSELDAAAYGRVRGGDGAPVYVLCQSGGRARKAIEQLERAGQQGCVLVEGGTQAWLDAGLPVNRGASRVLPLMRQVQITIEIVSATGAALALAVNPWFALLPLVTGCGLLFAGISGYCGLAMLLTKMPWNKSAKEGTGRLLGAQVLGEKGVDKRMDVFATAIAGKMSVFDLENLDLAYAPPFGSANDPVNIAGFVAGHIARGDITTVAPETWKPEAELLLDVRDADELVEFGKLPNALNIPLAELRDRLGELPRDRPIITYCQKGQRGYLAACALHGHGFDEVANLRGGFLQARLNDITLDFPTEPEKRQPAQLIIGVL